MDVLSVIGQAVSGAAVLAGAVLSAWAALTGAAAPKERRGRVIE